MEEAGRVWGVGGCWRRQAGCGALEGDGGGWQGVAGEWQGVGGVRQGVGSWRVMEEVARILGVGGCWRR